MRNFYTVLDYENNYIMLGLNLKGQADGTIGKPGQSSSGNGPLAFFLMVLILAGGVGGYLYWRKKKAQENNPFAKTSTSAQENAAPLVKEESLPSSLVEVIDSSED